MTTYKFVCGGPTDETNVHITGEGGEGYLELPLQDPVVAASAGTIRVFQDDSSNLSWVGDSNIGSLDISGLTDNRTWAIPDESGDLVTNTAVATMSNKTLLSSDGNTVDATKILGVSIDGLYADGDVMAFNSVSGAWEPLPLAADSPLAYNDGVYSVATGSTADTVTIGNDNRLCSPNIVVVKQHNQGAGEFSTIGAAIASITDASSMNRYMILVDPGTYFETAIVMKEYISLIGRSTSSTVVISTSGILPVVTMASNTELGKIAFSGVSIPDSVGICVQGSIEVLIHNIVVQNFYTLLKVSNVGGLTKTIIFEFLGTGTYYRGMHVDGRAINGSDFCCVTATDMIFVGHATTFEGVKLEGPYVRGTLSLVQVNGAINGSALHVEDGGEVDMSNLQLSNCVVGLHVANVGAGPNIRSVGTTTFDNTTYDLHIEHPSATGVFSGISEVSKVSVNPSTNISMFFTDPVSNGSVMVGDFLYGPTGPGDITEIGEMITYTSPLGEYTQGGSVVHDSLLDITIGEGHCYILDGVYPNGILKKVSWTESTASLAANDTFYIFADINGLNTSLSLPEIGDTTMLARVVTNATTVEFIDVQVTATYHWHERSVSFERDVLGPLYSSGSIVAANMSKELAITGGVFYYLNNKFTPSGQPSPATWFAYYHVAGVWTRVPEVAFSNEFYDDLTDLVALANNKWVKHSVFIVGDGVNEQYFVVYGQEEFATQNDANAGNNPLPPPYFEQGVSLIASIVCQEGTSLCEILDNRPRLEGTGSSTSASTSHGDLTGLGDDSHTQYLLSNGARVMGGNLDLGTHNIINVGTVSGVDVPTHASRHLPNGADPITSAAPLINLGNSSTNMAGTANSFARSDHSHNIDITAFDIDTLSGTVSVPSGGTGSTSLASGNFLVGNGTGAVDTAKVVPTGDVLGTTDTQTLTNKTILGGTGGNDVSANKILSVVANIAAPTVGQVLVATDATNAAWAGLEDASFSGVINVPHGGTGNSTLTSGNFLVGNGTGAVDTAKVVPAGDVLGTTDTQTLTNKTILGGTDGNDVAANKILSVTANVTPPTIGQALIASDATNTAWADIDDSVFSGVLSVAHGGTGDSTLTAGNFLVGNGTGNILDTKVVPSGDVLGTTDTQTLTNKTILGGTGGNDVSANKILSVVAGVTPPTIGQVMVASDATNAAWSGLEDASFSGVINVPHGGTGNSTLTSGNFLVGNGTGAVVDTKVVPAGDVLGTTDMQTLTNKTIVGGADGNDIAANKILSVIVDATAPTIGDVLVSTSATGSEWAPVDDSIFSGVLSVAHGGTGDSTLTSGNFLVGNGTGAVVDTKVVPAGDVLGTTDVQTLTNKTILGGTDGNDISANKILSVVANIAAPTIGQALIASDATNTAWSDIDDSVFSGVLSVAHGGTGDSTLTAGNFLVGNGVGTVDTAKVVPTGDVLGTTDTQTLTNKTILGGTDGNDISANKILSVVANIAAPTIGQALIASDATNTAWADIDDSVFSGVLSVAHGGTGDSTLTAGNFLVGNGTGNILDTKVVPSGDVLGTTDTQTLTNKTILGGTDGNDVAANKILSVTANVTPPTIGQVMVASGATDAAWSGIDDTSLSGVINVPHGGTGSSTLTSGNFLVGNGTGTVDTAKGVPAGDVLGTTDTQTLTNKTILGGTDGNDVSANKILSVMANVAAPTVGQVLVAADATNAAWSGLDDTSFSGIINVPHGGTGTSSLTTGRFLIGNGTATVNLVKTAPAGDVLGTTDTQTMTNKTIVGGTSGNDIAANKLLAVSIDVTSPLAGDILIATGPNATTWSKIADNNFTGTLSVTHGGTGKSTLTADRFLTGNGTSAVLTAKVVPTGVVVGTTDVQSLTNKTIVGGTGGNDIAANKLLAVVANPVAPTTGQVFVATGATGATWAGLTDASFSSAINVPHGGTGKASLATGNFLVGNGALAVVDTKAVPTGVVVGTSDIQSLTNKTIVGGTGGNDVAANKIRAVATSAVAPTTGQVLVATGATGAAWAGLTDASFSGIINVPHGGTGKGTLTTGNFLVGAGTAAVDTTKVAPTGDVIGSTDTQTLTNKTISSATNTVDANKIQTIDVSPTAPVDGQVMEYSTANARWEPVTPITPGAQLSHRWVLTDVKASGTNGGTLTSGAWRDRTINTISGTDLTSVTIHANNIDFIFVAGTYLITAYVPAHKVREHKCRLWNVTDAVTVQVGSSAGADANDGTSMSILFAIFVPVVTKTLRIQHYSDSSQTLRGMGVATTIVDTDEIYTTVIVEKLN